MKKRISRIILIVLAVMAFYCVYNVWISYHHLAVNKFEVNVGEVTASVDETEAVEFSDETEAAALMGNTDAEQRFSFS